MYCTRQVSAGCLDHWPHVVISCSVTLNSLCLVLLWPDRVLTIDWLLVVGGLCALSDSIQWAAVVC